MYPCKSQIKLTCTHIHMHDYSQCKTVKSAFRKDDGNQALLGLPHAGEHQALHRAAFLKDYMYYANLQTPLHTHHTTCPRAMLSTHHTHQASKICKAWAAGGKMRWFGVAMMGVCGEVWVGCGLTKWARCVGIWLGVRRC